MLSNTKKLLVAFSSLLLTTSLSAIEVEKTASIKDTTTSIMGINHIGLSVKDLDTMLAFYQEATDFTLIRRETIKGSKVADKLYGMANVELEVAVLKAPNMQLELTEFKSNQNAELSKMRFQGPGMTHTCYQSPKDDPAYDKFKKAGVDMLSRGDGPVDIGGYGVTYAYGYDPEGNMMELEQLDGTVLKRAGYDNSYTVQNETMWMSQVALVTHDIDRLMTFYQSVLGFKPYRKGEYSNNPKLDDIGDHDNLHLLGGWFKLNAQSKVMEFWQYKNPVTQPMKLQTTTDLGYSYSLEVSDINAEYQRLKEQGVKFVSEPQLLGHFWQVFANDIDGNLFSLRQAANPEYHNSVRYLDNR